MRNFISLFASVIFTLLLISPDLFSQASVTWGLTSNGNASVSGNLTAGAVSTGPGYRSGGIGSKTYNSNGVSSTNWIGYSYLQFDINSSYYNKDYYQYTVSPAAGNNFTINNISYTVSASTAPVSWYAYYSLDGFATYTALGGRNATTHSGLTISVPEGSTFTLRIYGMDLVSASTAFRNKNVVISGASVPSCIPQTANAGSNFSICKNGTTPVLGGTVGGSATTAIWSSNAGGTFTPDAAALNATWTPPNGFTGNALLTLTTTNGCATPATAVKTVTVNNTLTVNNPQAICAGGSYSINGHTYTSAGTYTDVLQTQNGCDSTVITTLTVQQVTLNNAISNTQNGTTLVAAETNALYQWVRCDQGNEPVSGATSQAFIPQVSGSYAVVLTAASCPEVTAVSSCISINKDDVGIAGNLQVAGTAEFEQRVTMFQGLNLKALDTTAISREDSTVNVSFLLRTGVDGTVTSVNFEDILGLLYNVNVMRCLQPHYPVWSNKPDVLFTGLKPCEGKVGIGTDAPYTRLDVRGNARFTHGIGIGLTTEPQASIHINNPDVAGLGKKNMLLLIENTQQKLLQLDNNGLLRAREIKVDLNSWPDYVFKKEYRLMPLKEVEAFISSNGHLPNVPKAEAIEADGVNLGEMNKVLMEKVEELTLYLIEQQKLIEAQQQRIEALENKK